MDWDGNELLLSDILGTDEDTIYKDLENEAERKILFRALNKLSGREKRNDAEGSGRSSGNFPVVYFPAGKENHDKAQTGNDPV